MSSAGRREMSRPPLQDGGGTGKLRPHQGSRCWERGRGVLPLRTAQSQVREGCGRSTPLQRWGHGGRPEVRAVVRILHEALPRKTQSEKDQSQYPWPPLNPWAPVPTPEGCVSGTTFLLGTGWLAAMWRPPGAPFTVQFKSILPWNQHRTQRECAPRCAGPASMHPHH